jgi:glycosyltransferase involved in cell wall biosynthesis
LLAQWVLHYLRLWDVATVNRVDHFIANSEYVARRIWKTYRREAQVIYPPVAIDRFQPHDRREEFYFTLSRFVPYKRVDLIVSAFNQLGLPLVVIGDGPDWKQVNSIARPNVQLLGRQPDEVVVKYMQRCKAFVYAAAEDFGITLVEAQSAGAPVITYGKGGATESIVPEKTGLFFSEQTVESVVEAIKQFESGKYRFNPDDLRQNAEQFAPDQFRQKISRFVEQKWALFQRRNALEY